MAALCIATIVHAQNAVTAPGNKQPTGVPKLMVVKPPPAGVPDLPETPGMPIFDLGNGSYKIGSITIDKNARTVKFPVAVNMTQGLIEYLLVNKKGKVHESLFSTTISPSNLHIAMLLLGVEGDPRSKGEVSEKDRANGVGQGPVTAKQLKDAPAFQGDKVLITAAWKAGEKEMNYNVEDLVRNGKEKQSAARGSWIYTGSVLFGGIFAAEAESSIIAMISDVTALINNPRPGHDDDTIWFADPEKIPAKGTSVEITIKLDSPKQK